MKNDQPQELLRDLFSYDNGKLFWLKVRSNKVKLGQEAGFYCQNGYHYMHVANVKIKRNRAVWIYHNGSIPEGMLIDHINGVKLDDRIENLRLASKSENLFNSKRRSNSTTKFRGVRLRRDGIKWVARITVNSKEIHLGSFLTEDEAKAAYLVALDQYAGAFSPDIRGLV